jgi:hypothetical protein
MKFAPTTILLAAIVCPASAVAQTDLGPLNLPTSAATLPFGEDFEAAAGVVPSYMALTAMDATSFAADADAWCNIGQLAACQVPFSGSYNLEMGLLPGSTNYHNVRNAMVLAIDGSTGNERGMSFMATHMGEETNTVDGVWVSDNGTSWYQVWGPWNTVSTNVWTHTGLIQLDSTPANTSGLFFVAFMQEDNFPYNDLDGAGVDDIFIPGVPKPPVLTVNTLTAGYYTTMEVESDFPHSPVKFLASLNGDGPNNMYGLTFALSPPMIELAEIGSDAGGMALFSTIVHPAMTGRQIWFQALVLQTGAAYLSNGTSQTVL